MVQSSLLISLFSLAFAFGISPIAAAVLSGQFSDCCQFGYASLPITVYYRSGLSGTIANLNSALSSESPVWLSQHASSLKLTLSHVITVISSGSMRQSLMSQPGAFGYLASEFLEPPLQSASIKSSQAYRADPNSRELALPYLKLDSSMLGSLVAPTKGYPIVSINWLLL